MKEKQLLEDISSIFSSVRPQIANLKQDLDDLRKAVKAIVKHLQMANDEYRDMLIKDLKKLKIKERSQKKRAKELRTAWTQAVGKERVRRGL